MSRALDNLRALPGPKRLVVLAAGAVFAFVSLVFLLVLIIGFVRPYLEQRDSTGWVQVPCRVQGGVSVSNGRHRLDFSYAYGGKEYLSDRAGFFSNMSRIRYHDGSQLEGWVDPRRPERFVLDRAARPAWWAIGVVIAAALLPLAAVLLLVHGLANRSPRLYLYLEDLR